MKLTRLPISVLFLLFLCSSLKLHAAIRYVMPIASGSGTGANWANASSNLQVIINSSMAGDEIWVAAGRYIPTMDGNGNSSPGDARDKTFFLKNGVKMYGGFTGTETALTQRPGTGAGVISTLSGDLDNNDITSGSGVSLSITNNENNAYHTILCQNANNTTLLDGFTVSGGNWSIIGSVSINGIATPHSNGAGMYNYGSQNIINNCNFTANTAYIGGGIYNRGSANIISNCSFINNLAPPSTNGLGSSIFTENNSNGQIFNCVFAGNNAYKGTIHNYSSSPAISNCTFSGNNSSNAGNSIYNDISSPTTINCILWNNGGQAPQEIYTASGGPVITYSVVKGGYAGTGNSADDPKFINDALPAGADGIFRSSDDGLALFNCSAAYNRGSNIGIQPADILGISRPQFATTDMGAYESTATLFEVPIALITETAYSCTSTTLLASGGQSYLWTGGATPTTAENNFTTAGTYSVTVTGPHGCTSTLSRPVVFGPNAGISGTTTDCYNVSLTATGGGTYLWSGGSSPATAGNTFTTSGTYTVTVTGTNGCSAQASANVIVNNPLLYVNGAVTTSGNGSSWATALKTVQEAIDMTFSCAQEIWVKAGTYIPTKDPFGNANPTLPRDKTFYLKDGVRLYGGFAGTESLISQRNINANTTILSGDFNGNDVVTGSGATLTITGNGENAYHVLLSVNAGATTVLDGFTVKGGYANGTGSITVETMAISRASGGGLYNYSSSISVSNCIFTANKVSSFGGAIYNTATSSPVFNKIIVQGNAANWGGGMSSYTSVSATLTNSIFIGNNATNTGGGIYNNTSLPSIKNCSFNNNNATGNGGAIYMQPGFNPTITNCIVWGNTGGGSPGINTLNSVPVITYSDVQGVLWGGVGNNSVDPQFVNAASPAGTDGIWFTADDGLALQKTSPLLDAGTNTATPALDILGNGIYNITKDMGAYENIQGLDVYSSSPTCQTITVSNISGNQWFYFRHGSGIVAALNPNGTNMGTVTAEISDATGAISFNSKTFLGRSVSFSSSNFPVAGTTMPNAYSLRLYYYKTELTEYNATAGGTHSFSNFDMGWWQGGSGCQLSTYAGPVNGTIYNASLAAGEYGASNNGFYLQFNLDHFTIFAATGNSNVLPLRLLSFTGTKAVTSNRLQWQTANEIKTKQFLVERSMDGRSFTSIATVAALGTGNGSYEYNDGDKNGGMIFYRLKMIDFDGRFTYSNIIKLMLQQANTFSIYPNPVKNNATLAINDTKLIGTTAKIVDIKGRTLQAFNIKNKFEIVDMSLLSAGIYFLQTVNGGNQKLIKE